MVILSVRGAILMKSIGRTKDIKKFDIEFYLESIY